MAEKKKITYTEPAEYFPKDIRRKYGLGEFAKDEKPKAQTKKTSAKKPTNKKK